MEWVSLCDSLKASSAASDVYKRQEERVQLKRKHDLIIVIKLFMEGNGNTLSMLVKLDKTLSVRFHLKTNWH